MGIIKFIPENQVLPLALRLVRKAKKSLNVTMMMGEELKATSKVYSTLFLRKIKEGIIVKRVGFGTKTEYQKALGTFPFRESPSNFLFGYAPLNKRSLRFLISDEKEMIFAVYKDKSNKIVFYVGYKPLIEAFLLYFNNIFKRSRPISPSDKTLFVVGVHGNEQTPIKVVKNFFSKKINYLVANKEAVARNVRFLETDLNRSFPGRLGGFKEEDLARKLLEKLRSFDFIIDLHSATCSTPPFVILTKPTKRHLELLDRLPVKQVVYMRRGLSGGKSLINHVPVGISLEFGYDRSKATEKEVKKALNFYLTGAKNSLKKEYFEVFAVLKKKDNREKLFKNIRAFKFVEKGAALSRIGLEERKSPLSFYPILPRERSYRGVLCLAARKIKQIDLERLEGRRKRGRKKRQDN